MGTTREDIAYWGIDELLVEPCCAVKYYSDIEICIKELDTEEEEKQREIEREKIEDFGPTWYGKLRKKLWDLFEYPQTSKGAKVCSSYYQDWVNKNFRNSGVRVSQTISINVQIEKLMLATSFS